MSLDTQLFYFFNNLAGQSPFFDQIIVFCASYLPYILVGTFLALIFFSHYPRAERVQLFWIGIISAIIARYGATELIRYFYQRPRPFSTLEVHQLLPHTAWSFPSGHAAFLFALSTAVYLYNKKWGIGFFAASTIVVLSRVAAGIHWPSDILAGAALGAVIAYISYCIARRADVKPSY